MSQQQHRRADLVAARVPQQKQHPHTSWLNSRNSFPASRISPTLEATRCRAAKKVRSILGRRRSNAILHKVEQRRER